MNRVLIKEINVWTVVRTVFPLAWIVTTVLFLLTYLLAGSMVAALADEFADLPSIDPAAGVAAGVLISLFFGFLATIGATICAAVGAAAYNLLAALGGGIALQMDSVPVGDEESEGGAAAGNAAKES